MSDQQTATLAYLRQVGITPKTGANTLPLPEPAPLQAPTSVYQQVERADLAALLAEHVPAGARSERLFHLIGECKRAGLGQHETVAALEPWCAMVSTGDGKYTGKAAYHVGVAWPKIPEREHDPYLRNPDTAASLSALVHRDQGHGVDPGETTEADAPNTWQPQPLDAILDGTYKPELPALMLRDDGHGLLYPGRTHSIHADSESGKSLVVQAEVSHQLTAGQRVAYIDFESDAASVTRRLLDLGTDPEAIRDRFDYVRPEVAPATGTPEYAAWLALLDRRYALVVLDGVTEAMDVLASRSTGQDLNERIARFLRLYPSQLAMRTGAAVVLIDHVVKNTETRGRHAIGGQHKLNGLSGAAYTVEVKTQPRRGHVGEIRLLVAKDRPGGVREHCPPPRTDRLQLAGVVRIDSTSERLQVRISAPDTEPDAMAAFRPTFLMERVSRWLEAHPGAHSRNKIMESVSGNKGAKLQALDLLESEGWVTVAETQRGSITQRNYAHARPFREADDLAEHEPVQPVQDRSKSGPRTGPVQTGPTGPPPYIGGPVTGTGLQTAIPSPQSAQTGPEPVRDESAPLQPCQTCSHPLSLAALSCPGCGELAEAPF